MFKSAINSLKRFTACSNGNAAVVFGLAAIPIMVGAGSAIDYGRYSTIRQQAYAALDAGTLAAAAKIYNDTDVTQADIDAAKLAGKKHFLATIGDVVGGTIDNPVFTYNATKGGFESSVSGQVDTNFMAFASIDELEIHLESEAIAGASQYIGSDLEVTVMLDTTGSMCNSSPWVCTSGRKIDALKVAANLLVDELVWADQSKNTSKVALVPFSSRVRLATNGNANTLFTNITGMPTTWSGHVYNGTEWVNYPYCSRYRSNGTCRTWSDNWVEEVRTQYYSGLKAKPCVTERYYDASGGSFGLTDAAPGSGMRLNGNSGNRRMKSLDSSETAITPNGQTAATYVSSIPSNYSSSGDCDGINNNNIVMPLTNDVAALKARINSLNAEGGTSGALGTAFAWYAISPNWASIWGTASAPQSYSKLTELNEGGKPKLYKIAVLMTDGEYNQARGNNATTSTVNTAALAMCSGMKAQGIEVYTVGFETNATAETLLEGCATDTSHFYNADGADALKQAFKDIGKKVRAKAGAEVRLSR